MLFGILGKVMYYSKSSEHKPYKRIFKMNSLWKDGQSAKPTVYHQIVLTFYSWRYVLLGVFIIISSISSFYLYLDKRYILDGPFDISGPKELAEKDKLTVRVVAPPKLENLVKFVGHYSICPVVDKIVILWHSPSDFPKDEVFKYTTTHSKVVFERIVKDSMWSQIFNSENINTPGIFTADATTFLTCEHLSFANSVLESSAQGLVGITPNIISKDILQTTNSVVWESAYNMLFWDGLLFSTEYLKMMANAGEIRQYLKDGKQVPCVDLLIPMYILKVSKIPPIWVDVDAETSAISQLFSLDRMVQTVLLLSEPTLKSQNDDKCIANIKSALQITDFQKSYTKSSFAKTFLTW